MRLIDADDFGNRMYHEAFEKNSDLQKWDSGCWIRYKLFENVLREQPSVQQEQRWIPCSERLPEESGQYLITVKYEHVDGYEDIYAEHGDWNGEEWDMFCFGHCGKVEDIVAWQPLPEPYRGGDSE